MKAECVCPFVMFGHSAKSYILQVSQDLVKRYKEEIQELRRSQVKSLGLIAHSKEMRRILELAHHVAKSDSTILVYGDSGTGKGVLAKYVNNDLFMLLKTNPLGLHTIAFPFNCSSAVYPQFLFYVILATCWNFTCFLLCIFIFCRLLYGIILT